MVKKVSRAELEERTAEGRERQKMSEQQAYLSLVNERSSSEREDVGGEHLASVDPVLGRI